MKSINSTPFAKCNIMSILRCGCQISNASSVPILSPDRIVSQSNPMSRFQDSLMKKLKVMISQQIAYSYHFDPKSQFKRDNPSTLGLYNSLASYLLCKRYLRLICQCFTFDSLSMLNFHLSSFVWLLLLEQPQNISSVALCMVGTLAQLCL